MSQIVRKNYPELGEVKAPYVHSVKHETRFIFLDSPRSVPERSTTVLPPRRRRFLPRYEPLPRPKASIFRLLSKSRSLSLLLMSSTSCAKCFTGTTAIAYPPARSLKSAACFLRISKLKLRRCSACEPVFIARAAVCGVAQTQSIYLKHSVKQTIFILTWLCVE